MIQKIILVLSCLAIVSASTGIASAQAKKKDKNLDAAREFFEKGNQQFKKEQYAEAADSFRAAYKTAPNWKILYNIAQSEAAAKHHGLALTAFERYLALGGDDINKQRSDEVESEITRLKKIVGYVTVEAPEGSTIIVDGVEYGVAPIEGGIPVSGSVVHIFEVVMPDGTKLPFKKVNLVSGNNVMISFIEKEPEKEPSDNGETTPTKEEAQPLPADEQPKPPVVEPETKEKKSKITPLEIGGWVSFGIGAGMLAGAGATGGLAMAADSDIQDTCPEGCYESNYGLVDKRDNLALATNVLLGVGGTAAAVGIGLVIYSRIKSKKERKDEKAILIQPILNHQTAGAFLEVRF
jgi:hypothetical protein